jgi:hypothetical protein
VPPAVVPLAVVPLALRPDVAEEPVAPLAPVLPAAAPPLPVVPPREVEEESPAMGTLRGNRSMVRKLHRLPLPCDCPGTCLDRAGRTLRAIVSPSITTHPAWPPAVATSCPGVRDLAFTPVTREGTTP